MSNLRKTVLSRGSKRLSSLNNDCSPVRWSVYFTEQQEVCVDNNKFNTYKLGTNGLLLLTIHGGGYSALTWSLFAQDIITKIECQVLAVDLRGHGTTTTDDDENLNLQTLTSDVTSIVQALYGDEAPPIILIGHSLGGAVAVETACMIPSCVGVCVIDVVEGTALESLSSMQSILRNRPSGFRNIEHAVQWSFRSGQTHNMEAARVSMPGQIKNIASGQLAANEITDSEPSSEQPQIEQFMVEERLENSIAEENEDELKIINETRCSSAHSKPPLPKAGSPTEFTLPSAFAANQYTWRINLSKTETYWNGWFKGLSQKFLDIRVPKVLLLANIHGLDTTLTVGQMQGKFQFQVLPKSGHAIHEDQPQQVADIIAGFLVKQKLTVAKEGFTPSLPAC